MNPMNRKNTKECDIYFSKLEKIKDNVKEKVEQLEMIPDEWIDEYKREYAQFSKCYFSKKLKIKGDKERIILILEKIKGYKEKINNIPNLVRIFIEELINNYLKFLDINEIMCKDFLNKL